jgi:cholesterol oxidase
VPGRHQLHVFPNYGHQDVFMGKNCHVDVFPRLVKFLNEQRAS